MKDKPIFSFGKFKIEIGIAGFLYILFSLTYVITHFVNISALIANLLVAISGLLCLVYTMTKVVDSKLIVIGILASLLMLISLVANGNSDIYDVLWIWAYMGVGVLLYHFEINPKVIDFIGYGILFSFIALAVAGTQVTSILFLGSQNIISVFAVFFVAVMFIFHARTEKPLSYIPTLFIIMVSIWSSARSGIVSGLVCLALVVFNNVFIEKKNKLKSMLKWVILVILAMYFLNEFFGDYIINTVLKFDKFGMESTRTDIWRDYLYGMQRDVIYFLFGVPGSDVTLTNLHSYTGNTHNAFLMLHSKFGMIGYIYILINIVRAIVLSIIRKDFAITIALLTTITRSMFDWTAFPGIYDVIFWYMILYVMDKNYDACKKIK